MFIYKDKNNKFHYAANGKEVTPKYNNYTCPQQYKDDNVLWIEPMTAKEIDTDEDQEEAFNNPELYAEEKIDGVRGCWHLYGNGSRIFGRRVSSVTGWFSEESDLLPQLRDVAIPELDGTVIDGEMYIPYKPFKMVSSVLNCLWDEAINRQIKHGFVTFFAFDILYYKGECIEGLPLFERKKYLEEVVSIIRKKCHHISILKYFNDSIEVKVSKKVYDVISHNQDKYPIAYNEVVRNKFCKPNSYVELSKKAYYEFIVAKGGEGVVLKDINGKYYHKRGREYQKIKKFITKDVIIMGFTEPTKEYKGKFPNDYWEFWIDSFGNRVTDKTLLSYYASELLEMGCSPVSKFWFKKWVGNIRYGVVITQEEVDKLPKDKKFNIEEAYLPVSKGKLEWKKIIEVGDCSGFDEEMRQYFSERVNSMPGRVIEVKANEIFKDTGKLRHPRFLRMRPDKSAIDCIWEDHING